MKLKLKLKLKRDVDDCLVLPADYPQPTWPAEHLRGRQDQFFWCLHHQGFAQASYGWANPLELTWAPIEHRTQYVRHEKPQHEVDTRLRWMRPVQWAVPDELRAAYEGLQRPAPLHKQLEWIQTIKEYEPQIMCAFRAELPGCPWNSSTGLRFPPRRLWQTTTSLRVCWWAIKESLLRKKS
jgi:hypothetical protein